VTDQTRNLLISLASHMAYMQGYLEARHELDDPKDYYWYRESVALRQKVTDALADGPAVPEGREPASVVSEPSEEELLEEGPSLEEVEELCEEHCFNVEGYESIECLQGLINDALDRWGTSNLKETRSSLGDAPAPVPVPVAEGDCPACEGVPKPGNQPCAVCGRSAPPAEGEVAELVECLRRICFDVAPCDADAITRAADLLGQRRPAPVPVPVSERLPGDQLCWWYEPDEDDDGSGYGGNWTLLRIRGGVSYYTHWLPANALPLPQGEGEP
jgi:hypothetical protein